MIPTAIESSTSIGPTLPGMEMCENCRVAPWKPLTLSAADSPANLFRSRVNGKPKPILGGYGLTLPVWWMSYDPDMSLWKTCQDFGLQLVVPKLSLILPRSAMTVNGTVFLLPPSERPTIEKGSSFWPTPTARDHKDSGPNVNYEKIKAKSRLPGVIGGSPNPEWIEWLMGFPIGWTDCE